jgi:hypothetical protein
MSGPNESPSTTAGLSTNAGWLPEHAEHALRGLVLSLGADRGGVPVIASTAVKCRVRRRKLARVTAHNPRSPSRSNIHRIACMTLRDDNCLPRKPRSATNLRDSTIYTPPTLA